MWITPSLPLLPLSNTSLKKLVVFNRTERKKAKINKLLALGEMVIIV